MHDPQCQIYPTSETFTASRWTKGNLFFPVRIIVTPQHVSRVKSRLFGSNEESIAMGKVASVQISTGVIWSNIRIDSSGGTAPITSHGHRKADALRIRELIEAIRQTKEIGQKTSKAEFHGFLREPSCPCGSEFADRHSLTLTLQAVKS